MPERISRRDAIVEAASRLFTQQGYVATSVRQIAEAVGVTEAALYYHFKDGKRELLSAVLAEHMPDLLDSIGACEDMASLDELLRCFMKNVLQLGQKRMERLWWIATEFRRFSAQEQALVHEKYLTLFRRLEAVLQPFVGDDAFMLSWTLVLLMFGYGQLFWLQGLQDVENLPVERLVSFLMQLVKRAGLTTE